MADKKVSELNELNATPADNDEIYLRDVSELASAESKRITVVNFLGGLVAHIAATVVHGAVSAATASKIVIRDASARAKFAAPAGAGDALIKGTRHLIAEMPTLTTDKIWKGVGGVPAEADLPAGGASIVTGSYVGNDGDNRQITTGFKCSMVVIRESQSRSGMMIPSKGWYFDIGDDFDNTQLHATDGFTVFQTDDAMNWSPRTYHYWAISE